VRRAWRRAAGPGLPAVGALLLSMWTMTAVHLTFFAPAVAINAKDEGYISALAMRLLDGRMLPYVDGVSHRGPMLYWVAALAEAFGRMSFLPIRVLALLCSLGTILLPFAAAWRARRPLAGGVAALTMLVPLVVMLSSDGLPYNGEPLLNVFALGALACLTVGLAPERAAPGLRWVCAAGVLAALGALTKQVAAVALLPFALWVAAAGQARGRGWRPLLVFSAAVAAPVGLVAARYLVAGELRSLLFYTLTYNSKYYMAPYAGTFWHGYRQWLAANALTVTLATALAMAGVARVLAGAGPARGGLVAALDRGGFLFTVALGALLSGAVSNVTLRDFGHYYVQAVPWFALLLGLLVEELVMPVAAPAARQAALSLLVLVPTVAAVLPAARSRLQEYRAAQAARRPTLPICDFVDQHSRPGDAMYVWGFAPDLYTLCKRRPASRYVYSTFQSGYVPFFNGVSREEEKTRVVHGSRALFLGDLDAAHPTLILDVPSTLGGRSMGETPAYAQYLRAHYCPPIATSGVQAYQLRPAGGCPGS
jgi:hypothetical protein